jgi:hypothetical protein
MLSRVRSPIGLLRGLDLQKAPGIAESLDWAQALVSLHRDHLDAGVMEQTIGCVLKVREDHGVVESHREALAPVLGGATRLSAGGHSLETDFGFGSVTRPQS